MSKTNPKAKSAKQAIKRAAQLIQRSNSWSQGEFLKQNLDSQGKCRSQFCILGALKAAVGGTTADAEDNAFDVDSNPIVTSASKKLLKTLNKNPTKYGGEIDVDGMDDKFYDIVDYNDSSTTSHAGVLRLLTDAANV